MSYTVSIKWGKEKFDNVTIDTNEPVEVLRAQIYALSGVPSERQKIMIKGKILKDTFKGLPIKDKMILMMMGSADKLFEKPKEKVIFLEDMDESTKNKALKIPLGLENLGNTCYMNAVVQTLRACPEFLKYIKENSSMNNGLGVNDQSAIEVTTSVANVYHMLNTTNEESVSPFMLWATMRKHYPHFGESDPNSGAPMQQDANECWTLMMRCFQNKIKQTNNITTYNNFIDQYFSISMESKLKCIESDDEPITNMKETELQLSCFLDKDVKYLMSGIKNKFIGELEKKSNILDRNAIFSKTTEVTRLPAYLSVQMVRFFYKEGKNGQPGVNAKILKDIKFPKVLDLYDVCSNELKNKLEYGRKRFDQMDNWKRDQTLKLKKKGEKQIPQFNETFLESENSNFIKDNSNSFKNGDNCSGHYELYGVLTHKGRSSSSGHYVSWTRPNPMEDKWYLFDDENVSEIKEEQVLDLSGGGDWHTSYVLLYGPRRIRSENADKLFDEEQIENTSTSKSNEMTE